MFAAQILAGGAIGFVGAAVLEIVPALRAARPVHVSQRPVRAGFGVASVVALAGLLGALPETATARVKVDAVRTPSRRVAVPAAYEARTQGARLVASKSIGTEGGVVVVTDPTSRLEGTRLEIPAGALGASETIRISERSTPPGLLPACVRAATPVLVLTKDDPGPFKKPILVTMPCLPHLGTPVPVYWDEKIARYRAVTLRSVDRAHRQITFETVHFTDFMSWWVNLFTYGQKAKLPAVTTDFDPASDAFLMANRGDYASQGNCLGMSIFAAWYSQHARALGAKPLRDRYVQPGATRGASGELHDVAEREIASYLQQNANGLNDFLAEAGGFVMGQTITGLNLISAMQATREPQIMLLRNANGVGHAVIAYGYEPDPDRSKPGHFLISDPNYPGEVVTYDYDTQNGFSNYSKASVDDFYKDITGVSYTSYSSLVSTEQLEAALKAGDDRFKQGENAAPSVARGSFVRVMTAIPLDARGRAHVEQGSDLVVTGIVWGGEKTPQYPVQRVVAYVDDSRATDEPASVGSPFALSVTPPAGKTSFTVTLVAMGLCERYDQFGTKHTNEMYAGQTELVVEVDAPRVAAPGPTSPSAAPAAPRSRGLVKALGSLGGP